MVNIPGVLPQLFAVERTGPQPGVDDTVRKVSERRSWSGWLSFVMS